MFAKSDWYIVRGLVKGCFENIYWKNPERGFTVQQLSHLFNTEIDITQGLSTYFIGEQRISLLIWCTTKKPLKALYHIGNLILAYTWTDLVSVERVSTRWEPLVWRTTLKNKIEMNELIFLFRSSET